MSDRVSKCPAEGWRPAGHFVQHAKNNFRDHWVRHGPKPGSQEAETEAKVFSILEAETEALTLFKLEAKAKAGAKARLL